MDKFNRSVKKSCVKVLLTLNQIFQGIDVTEAFECYHTTDKASKVLKQYFVRNAIEPRNYKFTYDDDGFYRTLKRRAANRISTLDKSILLRSNFVFDFDLFALFLTSIFAIRVENNLIKALLILLSSQCLSWLCVMSHNFIHQRDSWRMYGVNVVLFGCGWKDWRVFHGIVRFVLNIKSEINSVFLVASFVSKHLRRL
jgi:hypothetical protein